MFSLRDENSKNPTISPYQEIAEDLQAALEQFQEIATDLGADALTLGQIFRITLIIRPPDCTDSVVQLDLELKQNLLDRLLSYDIHALVLSLPQSLRRLPV
jgi:hypothetical protein